MSTATPNIPTHSVSSHHDALHPAEPAEEGRPRNISRREQQLSKWGGAALLLAGLTRGRASGLVMSLAGGSLLYRGWTGHCHAYGALGINTAGHNDATAVPAQQGVRVDESVTINRGAGELYERWSDLESLPAVMRHLKSVEVLDEQRSRWVAEGPLGQSVDWEAEVINQREPDMISWRSLPGSRVDTAGSVRFTPLGHDRGTVVRVEMKYNPPGGRVGAGIAWMFGAGLEKQLREDLARFKSVMEAGVAPTTAGQPRGA
ncbi:SRPBCC family protein [Botrimarina sp.]|uniref:SRPBCC family protein n=1 Tax=Botrimarina sp. TaxID=2795802 RepID=UPI0032EAE5D2